jgi:hypothetical protein
MRIFSLIIAMAMTVTAMAQFGTTRVQKIDEIDPADKLTLSYLGGDFALQSSASGEIEESAVTSTELGYVSGVTSDIQTQLDSKVPQTRTLTANAPLTGGGDLTADRSFGITQSSSISDGYLSALDWIAFNAKSDYSDPLTTDGDLLYYNTSTTRLGIGTEGQLLTVSSGFPSWQDPPTSVSVTTKGDLQTYSTVPDRLPVGTNGQLLSADSVESTGLKWIDPPASSPLTTKGDIYTYDTDNQRLAVGTDNQILSANSATSTGLEWIDPPSTSPTTTQGDIIVRGASEDERLAIGAADQLLTSNGTTVSWQDAPVSTTLTTKGDIQTYDTANARLPVGTDGQFLVADSAETTGLKWSDNLQGKLNPVTDYTSYTPTGTWTTNSTYTGFWRQVGDEMEVRARVAVSGAPNATSLFIDIPSGYTIDTSKLVTTEGAAGRFGVGTAVDTGVNTYPLMVGYSDTNTVFIRAYDAGATYAYGVNVTQAAPFTFGSGDSVDIMFKVPIEGWSSGVDAVVEDRELTIEENNTFLADAANSQTVTGENYDFINGNCSISASQSVCTFNGGVFNSAPSCKAIPIRTDIYCSTPAVSTSSATFDCRNNAGTQLASTTNIKIECTRAGTDYVKKAVIAANIEDAVYSPNSGGGKARICSFEIDNNFDECTNVVGNCISDCENNATGINDVTFNTGYWSGTSYNCTSMGQGSRTLAAYDNTFKTNTAMRFYSRTISEGTTALNNTRQVIICHGVAP